MWTSVLALWVSLSAALALPEVIRIGGVFEPSQDADQELALRYAVDRVNADSALLPRSRLSAQSAWIRSGNSFQAYKTVCALVAEGTAALVGPRSAPARHLVRSASSLFNLPQMEARPNLRPETGFQSNMSLDIFPHVEMLSRAFLDFINNRGWRSVVLLYTEPESLLRLQAILKSTGPSIRLVQIRPDLPVKKALKNLREEYNFIVDLPTEQVPYFFHIVLEMGMMTPYHNYHITSLDMQTLDMSPFYGTESNITAFRLVDPDRETVRPVIKAWNLEDELFGRPKKPQPITTETALLYDAVTLFAHALQELDQKKSISIKTLNCNRLRPWPSGPSIIKYMRMVQMEGLSGLIQFNSQGQRTNFSLDLIELKRNGFEKTQDWFPAQGMHTVQDYNVSLQEAQKLLEKTHIRVTTIANNPFFMEVGNETYAGYTADLVEELSAILHFNYTIHLVGDEKYGKLQPNGEWNGMIKELIDLKADIAVADLSATYERELAVDFTQPFMTLGIGILMRKPFNPEKSMFSFLSPFSGEVWMYMATAYLGVSLVLYVLARLTPYEWVCPHPCDPDDPTLENTFTLVNSFWFTLGSLMQMGSDLAPRAISTRLIASVWWFFILIIISSYTASLAAVLTSSRLTTAIKTVEDLVAQKTVHYGCVKGGSTEAFFERSNITTYKTMWETMTTTKPPPFVKTNADGLARVLRGNYAFLMESTIIEYNTERNCDLEQIGGLLDRKNYAVATPKGSPFRDLFTSAIIRLEEEGILFKLKKRWWQASEPCPKDSGAAALELSFTSVGGVFLLLFLGVVSALPILVAEFFWTTKKTPRDKRDSLCAEFFKETKVVVTGKGKSTRPLPPEEFTITTTSI